ncbi:hypothetical protein [Streptomyces phage phiScoe1]|nr:hypothetical protein [Streptomyces phage phiScoe1]
MHCTYAAHYEAHEVPATHYYDTVGGARLHLCAECADRFGYPEYLVPLRRADWQSEYGYLVASLVGNGRDDLTADLWPMDGSSTEWWLEVLGCPQVDYLLADAAWEPYRAHQAQDAGFTFEVTRVTCLPLV